MAWFYAYCALFLGNLWLLYWQSNVLRAQFAVLERMDKVMGNLNDLEERLHNAVDGTLAHEADLETQLAAKQKELEEAKANEADPETIAAIEAEVVRLENSLHPAPTEDPGTEAETPAEPDPNA